LHRRIINQLYGTLECGFIIEADPTGAQIVRLGYRLAMQNRSRIANRYNVILPIVAECLDSSHHSRRRQRRPRGKLPRLGMPRSKHLHVGSAHINGQHVHHETLFQYAP
jgi:hypothetical protein